MVLKRSICANEINSFLLFGYLNLDYTTTSNHTTRTTNSDDLSFLSPSHDITDTSKSTSLLRLSHNTNNTRKSSVFFSTSVLNIQPSPDNKPLPQRPIINLGEYPFGGRDGMPLLQRHIVITLEPLQKESIPEIR